ncbi:hypothetical protein BV22DRAFT_1037138 [Leucogyrophana mollusca]|uniref:Uncharacterized protein n=1 Tax=Leucogyrophana mollusca TaxID=85980 RepID=A0ACB8BBB4_9AGAM|nr:hypothetical protein BV22DRAFT_1037138 [Leucogyrophana mollusca]
MDRPSFEWWPRIVRFLNSIASRFTNRTAIIWTLFRRFLQIGSVLGGPRQRKPSSGRSCNNGSYYSISESIKFLPPGPLSTSHSADPLNGHIICPSAQPQTYRDILTSPSASPETSQHQSTGTFASVETHDPLFFSAEPSGPATYPSPALSTTAAPLSSNAVPNAESHQPCDPLQRPSTDQPTRVANPTDFPALPPKYAGTSEMSTAQVIRYDRNITIPTPNLNTTIPAMTVRRAEKPAPEGWTVFVHPEGALYYYHKALKVYTDMDLLSLDCSAKDLEESAEYLYEALRKTENCPPLHTVELVLEVAPVGDLLYCGYYFANNQDSCLFWLKDYTCNFILQECRGVTSLSHKYSEVEAQYWKHIELFPHGREIRADVIHELQQLITFAIGDTLTSHVSTSNALYSVDTLKDVLSLLNGIKDTDNNNTIRSPYVMCFIGRIMNKFKHNQFLHFHGEQCARLSRDQSVHGEYYKNRSLLMTILSPILFRAPYVHLRALHNIYVDTLINENDWKRFVERLNNETQDFNLLATVLLNANVGFLAINTVDIGNGRSLSQIASYISMVASFGSMLLGVRLVRKNHGQGPDMVEGAQQLLTHTLDSTFGLETLAITYSLPYALLMWGMLFFVLAFSAECFAHSDVVSRAPVTLAAVAVLGLVGYSIYTIGEQGWHDEEENRRTWIHCIAEHMRCLHARIANSRRVRPGNPV